MGWGGVGRGKLAMGEHWFAARHSLLNARGTGALSLVSRTASYSLVGINSMWLGVYQGPCTLFMN